MSTQVVFFILLEFAVLSREESVNAVLMKLFHCKTKLSKQEKKNYLNHF